MDTAIECCLKGFVVASVAGAVLVAIFAEQILAVIKEVVS